MVNKKKRRNEPSSDRLPEETQAADALTIGWMLAVVTTLVCQIGALVARSVIHANPAWERLDVFVGFLFFAAMAIGVLSIALIPVLYRIRKMPPPRSIVVFAIVVSIAPWVTLLVQAIR